MNPSPEPEGPPLALGPFQPPSIEELNELIPAYDFLEFLDRGGMGAVYRARQRSLDRIVAVKLLPIIMGNRKAFADRFKREARALALLNHPNIVSVYDFGEAPGGCLYYVMEYVKGTNLRQLMRAGHTTSRKLLSIAMQVCEALQFAHMHGVVHRDVKPANVLIDDRGHVKVADFGLAKVLGPSSAAQLTGASDALGTPEYMAPEVLTHQHEVDHRVDIYSLGVMLYEMLTGHVPRGAWEPPSRSAGADARFDDIVSRAMQTDPHKRFQNMGELSTMMKQLVQASGTQTGISSPALNRIPPALDPGATTVAMRPAARRGRVPRVVFAALGAAIVGGVGISYLKDHPAVQRFLGTAPVPPMQSLSNRQRQIALARFVLENGGFVNVVTPFQTERRMGQVDDIYFVDDLPRGDFTVWRISFDDREFTDEDLAAAVRLCENAGPVSNLNLHGSGITASGIAQLTRLADSLTSLKLTETSAFTEESMPFLSACTNLRNLFISGTAPDASRAETEKQVELVRKLGELLPECHVHLE
jgi:predicted Ser/Thr protein kinase